MLDILFEDNHIIVCIKPSGIASQTENSTAPDMVSTIMNYQKSSGIKIPYTGVIHRLDKPVEGIMVYAKNKNAAALLSKELQQHNFSKSYKAVLCTKNILSLNSEPLTLKDYLVFDRKNNLSDICQQEIPGSKKALLEYNIMESIPLSSCQFLDASLLNKELSSGINYLSLADVKLITGRHHQIRIQFSRRNMPLWGDRKYSDYDFSGTNIALCAYNLSFPHPVTGKKMEFTISPSNNIFKNFTC